MNRNVKTLSRRLYSPSGECSLPLSILTVRFINCMGKYGTPTTKTMENTRISSEGKRSIEGLLREHGLESRLNEFQFTSVTTLRTEGMFGVYNRDQVVPSALEFKYLSSRSALECAMKSAMGIGFKRKRERERRVMNTEMTAKCHCSPQSGKMIVLLLRKVRG